jgi:hypothetical protein
MTHDHSGEEMDQTNTAEGNVSEAAPSPSEAHAHHDEHEHDEHGEHDGHDAQDAHAEVDDASELSTLVPVTWRQLIFPLLILLLVAILLIGPVSAAFAPRPANPATTEQPVGGATQPTAAPTPSPASLKLPDIAAQQPPVAVDTKPNGTPTSQAPQAAPTATVDIISPSAAATRTTVAVLGEQGTVARAPVQLQFGGAQFAVDPGSGILPDWKPSGDTTHATWIEGTYANHILYLPYSDSNAALFAQAKPGDSIKLTMDSGQVFEFQVTRSQRASNGPPTSSDQFTVTTAMTQDHAGVTLFLVGDPASDRAGVQADFNGNIQ